MFKGLNELKQLVSQPESCGIEYCTVGSLCRGELRGSYRMYRCQISQEGMAKALCTALVYTPAARDVFGLEWDEPQRIYAHRNCAVICMWAGT